MTRITLTRQELYNQVWSQPTVQLAKQYGLSDVGLAKLCKRNSIPKPRPGYWAKKEAGKKVKQTPLPALDGKQTDIILHIPDEQPLKKSGLSDKVKELASDEMQSEAQIAVAETLRGAHELVSAAKQELTGAERDEVGFLFLPQKPSLNISVSKDQLRRSLLIMDAILKALLDRGYDVGPGPTVTIFDESVSFEIRESIKTIREQPEEQSLEGDYEFRFNRYNNRKFPSGKLTLFLPDGERYWASGCRKLWRDGKKQRLENLLNRFVAGLIEMAARKREHTLSEIREEEERQEAARRRREQAQKREELLEQQKAEQSKVDELLELVRNWKASQEIRGFVELIRTTNREDGNEIPPESELGKWIVWALAQADRFDPVKESPPSILDEPIPQEPNRW